MPGVLLDTGFLVALSKPDDHHHKIAREYWKYFLQNHVPIYLSTIVVAEFSIVLEIPDDILNCCLRLPFNYIDAVRSGKFDLLKGRDKEKDDRDSLKDDMKIIAHAAGAGVDYIITRDPKGFVRFCDAMREQNKIRFRVINMFDGFSESHFRQGQEDLLTTRGD